jgi:FAD/FMN-containing dehydrogenase/Fe-S oxidoreductase
MPDGLTPASALQTGKRIGDSRLAQRLRREVEGDVLFDAFERGRYSTDASIYQVEPIGVVRAKSVTDIQAVLTLAREEGVTVLPRGGGTSQCGQTVGESIVVDCARWFNGQMALDVENRRVRVRPGMVLGQLNKALAKHKLFFPIDPSTASRATIGGMAANNSSGARSIKYGLTVDNVRSIDALLADGSAHHFGWVPGNLDGGDGSPGYVALVQKMRELAITNSNELKARIPQVLRHVAGYNLHRVDPAGHNMANLLVGSEGTLAFFTGLELDLQPLPTKKVLGVCHFPGFRNAMAATKELVSLGPDAVELVDNTILTLSREMPQFAATMAEVVKGEPNCLLLVEFSGDDAKDLQARLDALDAMMTKLGYPDAVVQIIDSAWQGRVWSVREAGLNIVMSMKAAGKPISFIEDCAIPLEHLADFTTRLTELFEANGTSGTWYAHASVGLLHVRPVINLKEEAGAKQMRTIAEGAFELVAEYGGSHSGEHGDGFVRSEFTEKMLGPQLARAYEEVKDAFDPAGLFNPGTVVRPPAMDDRDLFRFKPGYHEEPLKTALDWSEWGGFLGAAEMCNNNGTCRKMAPDVMCPSFRVTQDEQHVTRGRANSLRLALSGQLGPDAISSEEMRETLDLCVGCKGCRRECPTGVDMAKMKIEVMHHYHAKHGWSLKDKLVAHLPKYALWGALFAPLLNLHGLIPGTAWLGEQLAGFHRHRSLPKWAGNPFRTVEAGTHPLAGDGKDVVLFADTFNSAFEPDILRASLKVLGAAGYRVHAVEAGGKPLCCGRTYLSVGMVDKARAEAERTVKALKPYVDAGVPVIGLEPACLLTLRDEFHAMLPGPDTEALSAKAFMLEEFLADEHKEGRLTLDLKPLAQSKALLHGHCHQKSFGVVGAAQQVLALVPGLETSLIDSSCCGMAGSFGYDAKHWDVSQAMAEAALLPAVRDADAGTLIVADGTSCRHQIKDGASRKALHVAEVLERALV